MKTSSRLLLAALAAAFAWPAAAQVGSPPPRQVTPSANNTDVVPDGVTFYRGQTYLLRNGRAALVDANLVPPDKVLTRAGGLLPVPPELLGTLPPRDRITPSLNSDVMQNGIVHWRGQSYLIRNGMMVLIDSRLTPEGQVYTAQGTLAALPSDFSGFVHDPNQVGNTASSVASDGSQTLSRQAGVPQTQSGPQEPAVTQPQGNMAAQGSQGYVRTGVVNNPDGTTTAIGVTSAGAAVPLNGTGALINAGTGGTNTAAPGGGARNNLPAGNLGVNAGSAYVPGTVGVNGNAGAANQTGTTGQNGANVQGTTTQNVNGTTGTGSSNGATGNVNATGRVNTNGATGTVNTGANTGAINTRGAAGSTNSNPAATQTGSVNNGQSTPTASQTGTAGTLSGGQNTTNPNSVPGNTAVSGGTTGATGTTGTPGNATGTSGAGTATGGVSGGAGVGSSGTSGGPSAGGGASGGGTGTSGGTSGGGTSGGASGGSGTSGGSSGGGTSGGAGTGG